MFLFSWKAGAFLRPCPASTRCPVLDDPSLLALFERRPLPTALVGAPARFPLREPRGPPSVSIATHFPRGPQTSGETPRQARRHVMETPGVHQRTAAPPITGMFRGRAGLTAHCAGDPVRTAGRKPDAHGPACGSTQQTVQNGQILRGGTQVCGSGISNGSKGVSFGGDENA